MTLDEIQKMTHREVDQAIEAAFPKGTFESDVCFTKVLDDCHAAEERVFILGKGVAWVEALRTALLPNMNGWNFDGAHVIILAHAPARQRAEAILLAVQEGETP